MKLLVTGASGYLGSSFINYFKDKYIFKKFSLLSQKLEEINFDEIDAVLHCAALVHQDVEYPYEKYAEVNVDYPLKLAILAKNSGVKKFVFISTIAVYGEDKEKVDENTACNPVTFYAKSKLEAEKKLLKLNDNNFTVDVIRIPMVYGKNAPGNIDRLIRIVKKIPVIPLGGIENRRSFISIQNVCFMIDTVTSTKSAHRESTFLACDDQAVSTTQLIEFIAKGFSKKVYLIKVPFFETLLRLVKPSVHKKLYGSLEIDNTLTIKKLFNANNLEDIMPYSCEQGIELMIKGEII